MKLPLVSDDSLPRDFDTDVLIQGNPNDLHTKYWRLQSKERTVIINSDQVEASVDCEKV